MSVDDLVPLVRQFCSVLESPDDSDERELRAFLGYRNAKTWSDIDDEYRCVILAEAGAGKTTEMKARARHVQQRGRHAFFIRIEDIDGAFENAFEVGSPRSFAQWLGSQDQAWFYLDSVDEARIDNPTTFEKAIRRFSERIKEGQLRAHVYISSRPYAWRAKSDRKLIQQHLPFLKPRLEAARWHVDPNPAESSGPPEDALEVYILQRLEEDDIRRFAAYRSVPDVDKLVEELDRLGMIPLAGRPFDLEEILDKWATDRTLSGRRELLHHNIGRRLRELDPDRAVRQPLNLERARAGARALAAAVVLTGKAGIRGPDSVQAQTAIDAEVVLADWDPGDVRNLLSRAIFDDVTYGAVRFRNRDARELLAAEWFRELLRTGHSREAVEMLFFREQYGEQIVSGRLRTVLPWLILDDRGIQTRVLTTYPGIAVEGGDPAQLPLPERQKILADILVRIVEGEANGTAGDNHALARIALPDLSPDARVLIDRHADNDDAVFFLGRLVWQGEMQECVPPLLDLAADSTRGVYARMVSARAVMTCGTEEQKSTLWARLNGTPQLSRRLLAELVQGAEADAHTVPMVLKSISRLEPYERFKVSGLTTALHGYIERLPLPMHANGDQPLSMLVAGLDAVLRQPPYVESEHCHISAEFAWLLDPAIHAVGRLVAGRAATAMQDHAMAIMLEAPPARQWVDHAVGDYRDELGDSVPAWPDLNDALFWHSVKAVRARRAEDGETLDEDWPVLVVEHYWSFGPESLPRVLNWVRRRDLEDDRLVALSLAFQIHKQTDEPAGSLDRLREATSGDVVLTRRLDELLEPPVSEQALRLKRRVAAQRQGLERQRQRRQQQRLDWISRLKADPAIVRNPPGLEPSEISADQEGLLCEIEGEGLRAHRSQGAAWRSLIEEFGEEVATAYRDAAVAHWRHCRPGFRSEGVNTNTISASLMFGLAGLAIESDETEGFPANLSPSERRLALRFIVLELNGFPSWLEPMYQAHPREVMPTIEAELYWELAHTKPDEPMHYILHDLAAYAPWLHGALITPLLEWLRDNDPPGETALDYIFRILWGGCSDAAALAALARAKATGRTPTDHHPYWYAMWVDAAPETGIVALEDWLAGFDRPDGSRAAQLFVAALTGSRRGAYSGPAIGNFLTPKHLKRLYVLMHEHIRVEEDIDRANQGVYSPELRDNAQDARNTLFQMLSDISGKEAHSALTELIADHPDPGHRPWMARRAYQRAEVDGDLQPWTDEQVRDFASDLTATPTTERQLFDLTVARVADLKNWLEQGDDSLYRTWAKAEDEAEVRDLVANWLNHRWRNPFTIAREPVLANNQRVDICLDSQSVPLPVPLELKLLDKGWSGPKLCERLRNQLARDYLREGNERYGVMLLFWQGRGHQKRWEIGGRRVAVSDVASALKRHWEGVS
ncbi:MAG: hypothetical protein F4Y02_10740, partial [Chloroflexi bacterium]|nr:hypothetical protein [Chloroflexota bacterium]